MQNEPLIARTGHPWGWIEEERKKGRKEGKCTLKLHQPCDIDSIVKPQAVCWVLDKCEGHLVIQTLLNFKGARGAFKR